MRGLRFVLAVAACAAIAWPTFAGAAAEDVASALTGGTAHLALRYRFEWVDQDSVRDEAKASTVRLRLNYATDVWRRWSGFVEIDHLAEAFVNDFNSGGGTSPGRTQYPTVADPKGTDLNQLYFQYDDGANWQVRLGRQRILLDNQRFVGGVGWRQNEQTYDAASFRYSGLEKATFFYSFVGNVNRIFGDEVDAGDHHQETHLLNAKYTPNEQWNGTAYAYLIDNDEATAFSTNTFGVRINGKLPVAGGSMNLHGEFARQSDAGSATVDFDANYLRLGLDWVAQGGWKVGAGFESLEGDATMTGQAFRTPLATLHLFNGWADQFGGTPDAGLDDFFVSGGLKYGAWKFDLVWHDFSAQSGSTDFGTELDLAAGRKFAERYGLLLKLAAFNADEPGRSDVTKAWLMLTAGF